MQPSSQNWPMLSKFADCNFGKTCTLLPCQDNSGIVNDPCFVAVIVSPPGKVTVGPNAVGLR